MFIRSRREFLRATLRSVTALGAAGAMSKFGEMNALAAGSGYQALVCIYLAGGNDGHNTVIPISTAQQSFSVYQSARGALGLAQSSLLPIDNGSDVYGLHPQLPEIQGRAPVEYLAGGTTLVDLMKLDVMRPAKVVDLGALAGAHDAISVSPDGVRLGAMVKTGQRLRDLPLRIDSLVTGV